jgi:Tol biopolymer transport system component
MGSPPTVFVRSASDPTWRQLSSDISFQPEFSPDGQWVAYRTIGGYVKVPVAGGAALPIADASGMSFMHWAANDTIVFTLDGKLYQVGPSGGEAEVLLAVDTLAVAHPFVLPDGRGVVFSTFTAGDPMNGRILVLEAATGDIREVLPSGNDPRYVSTGHLLYGSGDQALMAVPFDLEALETTGQQIPVIPDLRVSNSGIGVFDVTSTGTLIYAVGGEDQSQAGLMWIDMDGAEREIPMSLPPESPRSPRVSPDGSRLAYQSDGHIWLYDLETETNSQLTFVGRNESPMWSADGDYVYFLSEREGTEGLDGFRRATDGATAAEQVWTGSGEVGLTSISPDGRWLVVTVRKGNGAFDLNLALVDLTADPVTVQEYPPPAWGEYEGAISPNGRWMAYTSTEIEGTIQSVFVRGFPEPAGRYRVSQGTNAAEPIWAPTGDALYFADFSAEVMGVDVVSDAPFSFRGPNGLGFPFRFGGNDATNIAFTIHPDGDRFVAIAGSGAGAGDIFLVTDWFEELRERMGGN